MSRELQTHTKELGQAPLGGHVEKEQLDKIEEVVIVLGAGNPDNLSPDDFFPDGGIRIPAAKELGVSKNDLTEIEGVSLSTVTKWGVSRIFAGISYFLHKEVAKPGSVLPIFTCGFSGDQMGNIFHRLVEDAPYLIEGEAWDTSTNIKFTMEKLKRGYPDLYDRIQNGTMPVTIITSGSTVDNRYIPYNAESNGVKDKLRRMIGGMSNFGTHAFRVQQLLWFMLGDLGLQNARIRVLPSDLILDDLARKYKIEGVSGATDLSAGRGTGELVMDGANAFTNSRFITWILRMLASRRLKKASDNSF